MVDDMYLVLEQLYEEYFDIFQFDSFHYGGDEVCFQNYLKIKKIKVFYLFYYIQVDFRCWKSSEAVTNPMLDEGLSSDHQGDA